MANRNLALYGAIAANVAIAVTKFMVAGLSGSSAMLSEGIHSTVDTGNGLLLLIGSRLSERPPNEEHPFGHGKELYFWSLIVAVLIFGIGGGLSLYEGVQHIRQPEPIRNAIWNYVVLAAAAVFESISFGIALRHSRAERGDRSIWTWLRSSKDPATYTVLAEDGAALLGLLFAAAGVYASHRWNLPEIDGWASIAIGVLLAAVAVLLIYESRGLIVGEGVRTSTARSIREIALREPLVRWVGQPSSMYIGPRAVLLTLAARFDPAASSGDVAATIAAIESRVREHFPVIQRIYIEATDKVAEQGHNEPARPRS